MDQPYTPRQVASLDADFSSWHTRCTNLRFAFTFFNYASQAATEFGRYGFGRRLLNIEHCSQRIFETLPPTEGQPDQSSVLDATAFHHALLIYCHGVFDNLARVWVYQNGLFKNEPLPDQYFGVTKNYRKIYDSLPTKLKNYVDDLEDWYSYLTSFDMRLRTESRHTSYPVLLMMMTPTNMRPSKKKRV